MVDPVRRKLLNQLPCESIGGKSAEDKICFTSADGGQFFPYHPDFIRQFLP
jgi:hypothetical protein